VAEAGFFPGVILYLTYWFPQASRGRAMGFFYFGAPLAFIFGSPLSGLLLELDGVLGSHGWQWLFAVEGLMATAVGVWAYFYLDNRPADAKWLSTEERQQLQAVLDAEDSQKQGHGSVLKAMCQPAVLYLCAIYLLIQASVYGVVFYLPSQVAGLMGSKVGFMVGLVSAIPWVCALIAAWRVPAFANPLLAILALCFAASGFIAVQPVFWTFPGSFLAGSAAAGAIALINSFGALGGFIAPILKNWAEGAFQTPAAGLYLLSVTTLIAAALIMGIRPPKSGTAHKLPTFQH
jgi:MFS family permease